MNTNSNMELDVFYIDIAYFMVINAPNYGRPFLSKAAKNVKNALKFHEHMQRGVQKGSVTNGNNPQM